MKTFDILILLIYSIHVNIAGFYHISIRTFVRVRYRITNTYMLTDASDRRRRYRRKNSLTDLHEAVLKNCEQSVQYAIASGVPIDLADHAEKTALYYACERGYTKIVQILLKYRAAHHLTDLNQTSPLWVAAKEGHDNVVLTLLNEGADPNLKAYDRTTPLYQASYEGHTTCVYHLLVYGASVNCAKNSGASPLFVAARNGHCRIVKRLLKYGADPAQSQEDLRSPLHTALLYNRVRCARLLLQSNIDCLLQQTDIYGCTHLHFLAKKGNMKATRAIFHHCQYYEKPIDVTQQDLFGNTALHIAVFNKKLKFAHYLISKGFDVNQSNSFGWTYNNYLSKDQQIFEIDEPLPRVYLHDLLSKQLVRCTPEVDVMCNEVEAYVKELVLYVEKLNPLFCNTIIRSGSYYEGTRVGLPDEFDYMINLTEIQRLCTFSENSLDPSGFGRLRPINTPEAHEKLSSYLDPLTQCISSEKIRKQFYQLLTSARAHVIRKEISSKFRHLKFEWTSGDKRCGTAVHSEWYGTQYPCLSIKIDVVPCLTIYAWPQTANIKCPLETPEFHIIARSPKVDQTYLWRISTSQAELKIFQSLISEQMNGYLSLKSLRNLHPFKCEIDKVNYTADELITSYMFKNEFLHETIRYPKREQWINGSLIHRVLGILKRLHKDLLVGSIKSFYIKNYNVIDSDDYKRLRLFEIEYIRILLSQLKEKVKAMRKKPIRRNTFVATEPITRKHMLRERAFTADT